MQSRSMDLGLSAQVRGWTDSKAATAIASKRRVAKNTGTRSLRYSWLLDMTKTGRVNMRRVVGEVPGEFNVVDRLTKSKTWREID